MGMASQKITAYNEAFGKPVGWLKFYVYFLSWLFAFSLFSIAWYSMSYPQAVGYVRMGIDIIFMAWGIVSVMSFWDMDKFCLYLNTSLIVTYTMYQCICCILDALGIVNSGAEIASQVNNGSILGSLAYGIVAFSSGISSFVSFVMIFVFIGYALWALSVLWKYKIVFLKTIDELQVL